MGLREWLDTYCWADTRTLQLEKAARLLDMEYKTIEAWFYGLRNPDVHNVQLLIKRSRGLITLEGLNDEKLRNIRERVARKARKARKAEASRQTMEVAV